MTHVGSLKLMPPYLTALYTEAEQVRAQDRSGPLKTVYFGGGTPSLMTPAQVDGLVTQIDRVFRIDRQAEISLEAHPSTVDAQKLREFRLTGVSRISFGGESLDARELRALGRDHSTYQVAAVIEMAREAGFTDTNVDLMYGLPGQTTSSWEKTLMTAVGFAPTHLSLYPLSIEPRTVFARKWRERSLHLPADEIVAEMYEIACCILAASGYVHYEVANWALPGHECRHNLACWRNEEYYGLGVGAHAYLRPYRTENVRQTRKYIETVERGESPIAIREVVDAGNELAETMMLGLRLLQEGLDLKAVKTRFDTEMSGKVNSAVASLSAAGLLRVEGNRLLLNEHAVPVANDVWQHFV